MSATAQTARLSRKAKAAFDTLVEPLIESYGDVIEKGRQATLARIDFGQKVNHVVATMIAADPETTAELCQGAILQALRKAGFRVTTWGTIQDWQGAATAFATLAEEDRVVIAENGGVHALNRLKSITAKDDKRKQFAAKLVKSGKVTFDAISDAVKAENQKGKPKPTAQEQASKIEEKHHDLGVALTRKLAAMSLWTPEVQKAVTMACQFGYRA